jgi:hypothetical protein
MSSNDGVSTAPAKVNYTDLLSPGNVAYGGDEIAYDGLNDTFAMLDQPCWRSRPNIGCSSCSISQRKLLTSFQRRYDGL